jgi:hypothetical protein
VDAWFRTTSRIGASSSEKGSIVCPFCFGTGQLGGGSDLLHINRQQGGIDLRISENVDLSGSAETQTAA